MQKKWWSYVPLKYSQIPLKNGRNLLKAWLLLKNDKMKTKKNFFVLF